MTTRGAAAPKLKPDQILEISGMVAQYISEQRMRYGAKAIFLTSEQKTAMHPFFTHDLLDSTRLLVLERERVANPEFYPKLRAIGFTNLPEFDAMGAVTFCDVVVSHVPFSDTLLFHELVHVEQYWQLGITGFAELYVRGFLRGGGYDGIPLEVNAYALESRFEQHPENPFAVADEVRHWIEARRY